MAKQIIYTSVSMQAQTEEPMCSCLEIAGDDVNCKVHGASSDSTLPPKDERDVEEKKGWC